MIAIKIITMMNFFRNVNYDDGSEGKEESSFVVVDADGMLNNFEL